MSGRAAPIEGILVIDKEVGPTSHDVVARMRRILGMRRIGHCGTLDPLATGVLVLCLGPYTRLSEWISSGDKDYDATLRLGALSDTGDAQGEIEAVSGAVAPSEAAVAQAVAHFRGEIDQVPPAYSAVKVDGVRSYELARRNQAVDLKSRRVQILDLRVAEYDYPRLCVHVGCSKGTYIRSLARDLGSSLGCGAYVEALRRTRVGGLDLGSALSVNEVEAAAARGEVADCLVPPIRALDGLSTVRLEPSQLEIFEHGGRVTIDGDSVTQASRVPECAVLDTRERLRGVARWIDGGRTLRPLKVLPRPGGG